MRKLYLIILLIPFLLSAKNETVWTDEFIEVYNHSDYNNFGHSYIRSNVLKYDIYNFINGSTVDVKDGEGYLTSLTLNKTLKDELDYLLETNISINIKGRNLYKNETETGRVYTYQENERGIYISFMLEKVNESILNSIAKFYKEEPTILELVTAYYKNNYVIKILKLNNAYSNSDEPTIMDIMLNATMIADTDQLFWGVHDGLNFLGDLKKHYDSQLRFDILNDSYQKVIEP